VRYRSRGPDRRQGRRCPATVSGEPHPFVSLEQRLREGRMQVTTREPADPAATEIYAIGRGVRWYASQLSHFATLRLHASAIAIAPNRGVKLCL
jgi:hypothetical protein